MVESKRLSVPSLSFFLLLSKYEDRSSIRNLDFATTVKLQDRIDRSAHLRLASIVGNIMEGATFFASPEFTVVVTLLISSVLIYDRTHRRIRLKALLIPLVLLLIVCLEIVGKTIVHHPSPTFTMIKHPTTIFPANYINEQFSYPSGHAARAIYMAIITMLSFGVLGKKRIFLVSVLSIYAIIVSVSRIYLGHHWFSATHLS